MGAIGIVKIGDFVGEESLVFEDWKRKLRKESVYSEGESDVLELTIAAWKWLKDIL